MAAQHICRYQHIINAGVSAPEFASKFGMSVEEAVVFLEWIKVGIKFKEETLDNAKKAGLAK